MPIKLTKNQFVFKSQKIHGDKYDYSLVEYNGNESNVRIICPQHGEFKQTPATHLRGFECSKCSKYKNKVLCNKLKTDKFILMSNQIHENKYDYSLVDYKNSESKVIIICPEHGEFEQTPYHHSRGSGCQDCAGVKRMNTNSFVLKSKKIHDNKYDYSLVDYKNTLTKVKIICCKHGEFEQIAGDHLSGKGCMACCIESRSLTNDDFILRANEIHNGKYDYSKTCYQHNKIHVTIICPNHGEFEQLPLCHIYSRSGCPICKSSRGEKKVYKWLKENNFNFTHQIRFDDCRNTYVLPFDFGIHLCDRLVLVEYQGEQHYRPVSFGGTSRSLEIFNNTKKNDDIKKDYCKSKGYELIEIPFDCKSVHEFLEQLL